MMGVEGEKAWKRTVLNCLPTLTHPLTPSQSVNYLEGVQLGHINKFCSETLQLSLVNLIGYVKTCQRGQMPEFSVLGDQAWVSDVKSRMVFFCKAGADASVTYGHTAAEVHFKRIDETKEEQTLSQISLVYPYRWALTEQQQLKLQEHYDKALEGGEAAPPEKKPKIGKGKITKKNYARLEC